MQTNPADAAELDFLWASEVGTPPPMWGCGRLPADLADLAALRWDDCIKWARAIVGRELLGSEVRRLQAACGFSPFASKKKAKPGDNPTNRARAKEANRKRVRVLAYVATALRRAVRRGVECDIFAAFKAGCKAVFGSPQPYGNRCKVKTFREWVADKARHLIKKMSPTPTAPFNNAACGMFYAPTGAKEDFQNLTHPDDTLDASPADVPPETAFGVPAESRQSASASGVPARLVGLARSALPSFQAAHRVWQRIAWHKHGQAGWVVGWLAHWLKSGRKLGHLRTAYREELHRFDVEAMAPASHGMKSPKLWGRPSSGGAAWGAGQALPIILRRRLQERAAALPGYAPEAFAGAGAARLLPADLEARRERAERRAALRAERAAVRAQFPEMARRDRRKPVSPDVAAAIARDVFGDSLGDYPAQLRAEWQAARDAFDIMAARRAESKAEALGIQLF